MTDTADTQMTYRSLDVITLDGITTYAAKSTVPPAEYPNLDISLMLKVLNTISKVDGLWDQAVWRRIVTMDYSALTPQESAIARAALDQKNNPECGTPMCFAGWTTQIAKSPFVISARLARLVDRAYGQNDAAALPTDVSVFEVREVVVALADLVFVEPKDGAVPQFLHAFGPYVEQRWMGLLQSTDPTSTWLRDQIILDHGPGVFDRQITSIEYGAQVALGIGNDPLGLFEGNNNLAEVVRVVDAYLSGDAEDYDDYDDYEDDDYDNEDDD